MSSTGYIIIKTKNRKEIDHMTSILKIAPSLVGCVSIRSTLSDPCPFHVPPTPLIVNTRRRPGPERK